MGDRQLTMDNGQLTIENGCHKLSMPVLFWLSALKEQFISAVGKA
jgi:hypothetical protein